MADSPVERLIDQGLERYGKGDLDGALVAWESALALNPDDARAAGYVEYVRSHYDLLRGRGGAETGSELAVPFGLAELHDSDRYEIEIDDESRPPRAPQPAIEAYLDRVDDGWFLDEESALPTIARPLPLPARPDSAADLGLPLELELEADEPGDEAPEDRLPAIGPYTQPRGRGPNATGDDDQTQDFGPARLQRLADFEGAHPFDDPAETRPPPAPAAPADDSEPDDAATPGEFDYDDGGDETAEVGKRHLGFVKLAGDADPAALPGAAFAGPDMSTAEIRVRAKPDRHEGQASADRPALEPAAASPDPALDLPAGPGELPDPESKTSTLDLGPPGSLDLGPAPERPAAASNNGLGPEDDERTQERGRWARARSPRASSGGALDHLDLDDGGSPSIAPPVIIDDPVLSDPGTFDPAHRGLPTRELPALKREAAPRDTKTKDFPPAKPTTPTRDFPPAREFPPTGTTAKTIPRGARVAVPPSALPAAPATAAVSAAPVPPLIAELDAAAPAGESVDDRTRRRINALLDRATAASKAGQHVDAVAACDLALAEAPDSAVAQKLVHRSRDAILAVYQGFLGDLGARPSLAVPMHELPREQIDSRGAFLLSRVDGNLSFEEILDVSGMTRLEALRHLARLVGRGILSVR